MNNFIPYGQQKIFHSDLIEVNKALKSKLISSGEYVTKFENAFKKYTGAKYAISCSSGTAAIHLALEAIGVKKKDNIILPSINFVAAANMSKKLQANIFLTDVDQYTGQMRPEDLINCINKFKIKKIKAIFIMHNGGNPNNIKKFYEIKKKFKTILIEDACHALGAKYYDQKKTKVGCCTYSDISVFSLHPLKSITSGEGGVVTTSSESIYKKIKLFRNHGIQRKKSTKKNYFWSYDVLVSGYNYRLSDINCALALSQLKKINKIILKRKKIAKIYFNQLKKLSHILKFPNYIKEFFSAWHLFIININFKKLKINKNILINELYKKKIISQVHYIPTNFYSVHKNLNHNDLKNSKKYFNNSLSLPIFYDLSKKMQNHIIKSLTEILKKFEI